MSDKSAIEWTEASWNPTVGCSIISPGCTNCYAMKTARSLEVRFGSKKYTGLTKVVNDNAVWTGAIRLDEDALLHPLRWKKPRRIFVNSMSDLFHGDLPDEAIDKVFAVMALCPQHTFQVLTKRAERMFQQIKRMGTSIDYLERHARSFGRTLRWSVPSDLPSSLAGKTIGLVSWPLPNVWLGISAERQEEFDERERHLRETPAAVRFFSLEPLLDPINMAAALYVNEQCEYVGAKRQQIDWVIVGGESGSKARPMDPEWARSLRDQCQAAGVAYFFKQWGEWHSDALRFTTLDGKRPPPDMKIGKKRAGRLLDGREWNEYPNEKSRPRAA